MRPATAIASHHHRSSFSFAFCALVDCLSVSRLRLNGRRLRRELGRFIHELCFILPLYEKLTKVYRTIYIKVA